jgi:orotidine-5'-phosphate decarboxylase
MQSFREKLSEAVRRLSSLACVGLDPDPARIPSLDLLDFNRTVIDATADLVCAYKPQMAFYEALGIPGFRLLEGTLEHIREAAPHAVIIGDGKRGDIGTVAEKYAEAMFQTWDFDAATVNVYQGADAVLPFLEYRDKGVFIVCRSSNPSADMPQDLRLNADDGSAALYEWVAGQAAGWNDRGNVGLVVGGNRLEELASLRQAHPDLMLLVPGVGTQGGSAAAAARAAVDADGRGAIISSSRGIIYPGPDEGDLGTAVRKRASRLVREIAEAIAT